MPVQPAVSRCRGRRLHPRTPPVVPFRHGQHASTRRTPRRAWLSSTRCPSTLSPATLASLTRLMIRTPDASHRSTPSGTAQASPGSIRQLRCHPRHDGWYGEMAPWLSAHASGWSSTEDRRRPWTPADPRSEQSCPAGSRSGREADRRVPTCTFAEFARCGLGGDDDRMRGASPAGFGIQMLSEAITQGTSRARASNICEHGC